MSFFTAMQLLGGVGLFLYAINKEDYLGLLDFSYPATEEELSPEVEEWNRRTLAIRDVYVGMYQLTGTDLRITVEEAKVRVDKLMAYNAAAEKPDLHHVTVGRKFLSAFDVFDENREWVKNFNKA